MDKTDTNQNNDPTPAEPTESVVGPDETNVSADVTALEEPTVEKVESLNEQTSDDMAAHQEETPENPATANQQENVEVKTESSPEEGEKTTEEPESELMGSDSDNPLARWYVVHTASGHENRVSNALKQRIESEHLEDKILDVLVPTQDKIEIRSGKKETVKEKIFPGYILVKMVLDDNSWLSVRTTPGVTSFVGIGNKPTPIPEHEVRTIVKFMTQGAAPTFKDVFMVDDTVKIVDGPFSEFIGKIESVDKEKGKVRVLVSIFGRETPVELDFLQVTKL